MAGAQTEEVVAGLEQALGVTMPPSYRQFLLRYGGLGIGDSFISGIVEDNPLDEGMGSLFGDTQRFRQDYGLPEHLLVVQADEDAPYCLDTSHPGPGGEYPLVSFELHSQQASSLAPTFGQWLTEWLRLQAGS